GEQRIMRRRTPAPIHLAGFNLGNYAHAHVERGGYRVDVVANRALEKALQPRIQPLAPPPLTAGGRPRRTADVLGDNSAPPPLDPLGRLHIMANEVASALEF